ncbi:MAG: CehA/McbA family metallohydrolase [Candidatus Latescibacteria bacterium]|nr:CehA/McbA family metallohydrolase [Candidatus Latescibacterota bacterium]
MVPIVLQNPYRSGNDLWLKGNLHAHTTRSDGTSEPEAVIAAYEGQGYDFLAITDHDLLVSPDAYQGQTSIVLIPGVEVSARGPHILHIGAKAVIEPDADRQRVIDAINASGGLAILNHPNFERHFNHFPQELMESLEGAVGVEVYNGLVERYSGAALASDRWDRLLSKEKWLWGFGTDDLHRPEDIAVAWIVVQAETRTADAILDGIRRGRFYASTGVTINEVIVNERTVTIHTEDAQRIRFITGWGGVIRSTVKDRTASWTVPDVPDLLERLKYVRIECYGEGGLAAWTQPIRMVLSEG